MAQNYSLCYGTCMCLFHMLYRRFMTTHRSQHQHQKSPCCVCGKLTAVTHIACVGICMHPYGASTRIWYLDCQWTKGNILPGCQRTNWGCRRLEVIAPPIMTVMTIKVEWTFELICKLVMIIWSLQQRQSSTMQPIAYRWASSSWFNMRLVLVLVVE